MKITEFCSSLWVRALHKCCHCLCHHEWGFGVCLYGLGHLARAGWEGIAHLLVRALVWDPGEKRQNICPELTYIVVGAPFLLSAPLNLAERVGDPLFSPGPPCLGWTSMKKQGAKGAPFLGMPQPKAISTSQVRCKRDHGNLALQPCPAVCEHVIE